MDGAKIIHDFLNVEREQSFNMEIIVIFLFISMIVM
jgi:hypothetical protein